MYNNSTKKPPLKKITVRKIEPDTLHNLREGLSYYSTEWNNLLAAGVPDPNCEVIYSLTESLIYSLSRKIDTQYPPKTYTLTYHLHEARLVYNALLAFGRVTGLHTDLDQLKNMIHVQLPIHYARESFTTSMASQRIAQRNQSTDMRLIDRIRE